MALAIQLTYSELIISSKDELALVSMTLLDISNARPDCT